MYALYLQNTMCMHPGGCYPDLFPTARPSMRPQWSGCWGMDTCMCPLIFGMLMYCISNTYAMLWSQLAAVGLDVYPDEHTAASALWDAKQDLNWHPWPLVTFLCKSLVFGFAQCGFIPLLWPPLWSLNKIHIYIPGTHNYSLPKTQADYVDSLARYSWFVSDFAFPWQW